MGVSFKVAKAGTRYRPKLLQIEDKDDEDGPVSESHQSADEVYIYIYRLFLYFVNLSGFFISVLS
jgi:hypothetical protein